MIPAERQSFIYQYACEHQLVTIEVLATLLKVSPMTIRRDIQTLELEGKIISVSGGVKIRHALTQEPSYQEKSWLNKPQKICIGEMAADLIQARLLAAGPQTIYLDAGTTAFEIAKSVTAKAIVAKVLAGYAEIDQADSLVQKPLTIISNDFSIIAYLMNQPNLTLFHTGGQVDQRNGSAVGNQAAAFIRQFNIDMAFISTSSWDLERGVSTPCAEKIPIKESLLDSSIESILVTDSSKYGEYSRFKICELAAFQRIITDSQLPMEIQSLLSEQGIDLLIAHAKE